MLDWLLPFRIRKKKKKKDKDDIVKLLSGKLQILDAHGAVASST